MFARTKKAGKYEYLQIVENHREGAKVNQRVIATLGRLDQMQARGEVETLVRSLARFSEQALLILSGRSDISAESTKIGPAFIFERLRQELGIAKVFEGLLSERFFTFNVERALFLIDREKVEQEARFDGKWVLRTNTRMSARNVALKYKELWQVEHTFRYMKPVLETRPVCHRRDETIRGHVFCSYLALMLKKDLYRSVQASGHSFKWAGIKQDLKALTETVIEEGGKRLAERSKCKGVCGKVFQSVGVAIPPTICEIRFRFQRTEM